MRSRALSSVVLVTLALATGSCGGKAVKRNIAEDPQRGGGTLEPISARFNDLKPSMSRDGTRFVFVSGRDATDTAPTLKVYKAEWPAGAAPAAAARVTTTDFGVEKEAKLSPDGNWVVMTTVKDGRTDLVLVDFASTKVAKITDDAAVETGPAFSPDSKFVTWVTRGSGATNASVWVLEIKDDLVAAAAAKVRATAETDSPAAAFFAHAASGYQLGIALQSPGKGAWDLKLKAFTTLAEAGTATPAAWLGLVPGGPSPGPAAGAARVAFVRRILTNQPKQATTLTAALLKEKAEKRPVITEVAYADATPGAGEPVSVTAPIVAEVLAASLSEDGQTAFALGRNNYLCDDATEGFRYGAFFLTGAADGSTLTPLVPLINPDGSNWVVGLDPCQKLYDKFVRLDDKISEIEVNGGAKSDTFRMLYVTRFTKAFDVDCRLRVSDSEIMALDTKGLERTIYAASNNPAPLVNADRGDQPACQL